MSLYTSNWSRVSANVTKKRPYRGYDRPAESKELSLSKIAAASMGLAEVEGITTEKQPLVSLEDVLGLNASSSSSSSSSEPTITSHLAMDCEMVGAGQDGLTSVLARCSVVNFNGQCVYDKFVKPKEYVTDFRTEFSGVRFSDIMKNPDAVTFEECQRDVFALLKGRVLIGHSIQNDLKVLMLDHPGNMIRDTAYYKGLCPHRPVALKRLMEEHLSIRIQQGEHDSVTDARAVLALYRKHRAAWEADVQSKRRHKPNKKRKAVTALADTNNNDQTQESSEAKRHKKKKKKKNNKKHDNEED